MIVYYNGAAAFERKAYAIADLLSRRGFRTSVLSGLSYRTRLILKTSPAVFVGFWNHVPLHWLPETYIAINAEPIEIETPTLDHQQLINVMRGARQVWNYSQSHMELVKKLNARVHFVPFGYAPYYEVSYRSHTERKFLPQDIDALFYGSLSSRRQEILERLRRAGLIVHVADPKKPVYGAKLDELIARSKIVLGIHYYDEPEGQIADLARLDHLLSNRIFVIHEKPSSFDRDFAFQQNVTICECDKLIDMCRYFIDRPDERTARSKIAYQWFRSQWPLDKFIPYSEVVALLQRSSGNNESAH